MNKIDRLRAIMNEIDVKALQKVAYHYKYRWVYEKIKIYGINLIDHKIFVLRSFVRLLQLIKWMS